MGENLVVMQAAKTCQALQASRVVGMLRHNAYVIRCGVHIGKRKKEGEAGGSCVLFDL